MIKAACSKVGDRGFEPQSDLQVSKKQNVSSPLNIVGSLCDRGVAYAASDCRGSHFETFVWTVSSNLSHHPQEVLLAQFIPFKPEFTIVIFIHYKPRIAVAILALQWMKMT